MNSAIPFPTGTRRHQTQPELHASPTPRRVLLRRLRRAIPVLAWHDLRNLVVQAEETALVAAVAMAKQRSGVPVHRRFRGTPLELIIEDQQLGHWLHWDGRAHTEPDGLTYVRLTKETLPGLSHTDVRDPSVLRAYVAAFTKALAAHGYRARILVSRGSAAGRPDPPRSQEGR